ncbi:hypothetical protein IW261DRAFT_1419896 [Armillaria novae-zelandiae]|uniref:Uncharacterized protein n=1 Tax=Armillaria novae-zelandiae TaxID=153914 RepID=A0AA39P7Q6_9AGAR|nr:hypothetical protein IW261DRAFT_1419896 [Armillaria novae-zelandiae]
MDRDATRELTGGVVDLLPLLAIIHTSSLKVVFLVPYCATLKPFAEEIRESLWETWLRGCHSYSVSELFTQLWHLDSPQKVKEAWGKTGNMMYHSPSSSQCGSKLWVGFLRVSLMDRHQGNIHGRYQYASHAVFILMGHGSIHLAKLRL